MSSQTPQIFTEEIDTLIGGADSNTFVLQNNGDQLDVLLLTPPATHQGTFLDDEMFGTPGDDVMYGRRGNDTISAFTGNDFINGESGDDLLFGGQGDDILIGEAGDDTLFGDRGDDTLYGGSGDDVLFGNSDNDTIYGDSGDDTIYGGQGDDFLVGGTGSDLLLGDRGNDTLYGVSGRGKGYTYIQDFNPQQDTILLSGNVASYELMSSDELQVNSPIILPQGTAIIFEAVNGSKEMIAIVAGNLSLDLNANYFDFS